LGGQVVERAGVKLAQRLIQAIYHHELPLTADSHRLKVSCYTKPQSTINQHSIGIGKQSMNRMAVIDV
jgi:hypothetical protein